jgi:uncharacterized protein YbcV (DUF1398 family)
VPYLPRQLYAQTNFSKQLFFLARRRCHIYQDSYTRIIISNKDNNEKIPEKPQKSKVVYKPINSDSISIEPSTKG